MTRTSRHLRILGAWPLLGLIAAAACGGGSGSSSAGGSVRTRDLALRSGAAMELRSLTTLSTRNNHAGDPVRATAVGAALSAHGDTVIPAGAEFYGTVASSEPGKPNASGTLQVGLSQVRFGGHSYPIRAQVTAMGTHTEGRGITGGTAAKVGAGAVAGGIAGRIIGGNRIGTLVGAATGAAAGGVYAHETRDVDIVLPAGARIRIALTRPFTPEVASK